jgi:hypothetical protein
VPWVIIGIEKLWDSALGNTKNPLAGPMRWFMEKGKKTADNLFPDHPPSAAQEDMQSPKEISRPSS